MKPHSFHQKARMLFGPLVGHRIIVLVITLTIVAVMVLISYGLELIEQNKNDLLLLASELLTETGPNYVKACREYANIMEEYMMHMEEKPLSLLIRWLYPHGSPYKLLGSIVSNLERARGNEEAKEAIIKAGEELFKFCGYSEKYSHTSLIWLQYRKVPENLVIEIERALAKSQETVEKFKREPSLKNAVIACEDNRKTMLLLFLWRSGYHDWARIKSFRYNVQQARDCFKTKAYEMVSDDRSKQWLLQYTDSEQRRMQILDAMLDNDMDTARELLWDAIEQAFKEKHGLRYNE